MAHIYALRRRHTLEHEVLRVTALGDACEPGQLPADAPPDLAEAALRKLLLQRVAADLVPAASCKRRSVSSPPALLCVVLFATCSEDASSTMQLPMLGASSVWLTKDYNKVYAMKHAVSQHSQSVLSRLQALT